MPPSEVLSLVATCSTSTCQTSASWLLCLLPLSSLFISHALSPPHLSPPKRPRLSLQIIPPATQTLGKSSTALRADINPTSPTAFNTLSNAYAAAVEDSSSRTTRPVSAFALKPRPTPLRLETKILTRDAEYIHPSQRTQTPGPFSITYPNISSSAFPDLTPANAHPETKLAASASESSCTFTPPQSAESTARVFTFDVNTNTGTPISPRTPRTPRQRATIRTQVQAAPYTHPRSLRSILRNSQLPPRSTTTLATPTRMSMRLINRANKKVGYHDPLTQTITTNKYVKSHIDLLSEDSPYSATDPEKERLGTLDLAMAYTGDETRDGGQTPGPFEEMRRRMAESDLETPGSRKRKRGEKKRKWEWTITSPDSEGEEDGPGRTPITAVKIEQTPATAIWRGRSTSVSNTDSELSEAENPRLRRGMAGHSSKDSEMSDGGHGSNMKETHDTFERPTTSPPLEVIG